MKRSFPVLLCALIPVFTFVSVSHAQYSIIQLTYSLYDDPLYQINENGYVVWRGCFDPVCGVGSPDAGDYEILLYDGTSTIRLTDDDYGDANPQINNGGLVFWTGGDDSGYGIFRYDGTSTTLIPSNGYGVGRLQVNDNGHMAWYGSDDGLDTEILLYNGTSIIQLTDNDYMEGDPQINNNGHVVWEGCDTEDCGVGGDGDYEIFLFDGTTTSQLTNNDHRDDNPQISNNGYVVWEMCEGGTSYSCTGGDYEIFLYNGTTTTQLTDNEYDDMVPQINDNGYVVWRGGDYFDESAWEIFLYDGTSTTQLTTSDYRHNTAPQISNSGNVVWRGSDGSHSDIFLYDGASTTRITNNAWMDGYPKMNDRGEIVWWSWQTDYWGTAVIDPRIRLAIPCSLEDDNDDDGYVSFACGGDDCNDGDPAVNPGMSESEVTGNCSDGKDNDCDGSPDCNDPDCPACPTSCAGNAAASTLGATSVYGASDLGKHLAFFVLPVGAVIGLRIWRHRKR